MSLLIYMFTLDFLMCFITESKIWGKAKSTERRPEIETETELSCRIMPPFSIKAQYLACTSQMLLRNTKQNLCTKTMIFWATTLESLKTATDSQYHLLKTKLLHRATLKTTLEMQSESSHKTHEEEQDNLERASQTDA
ncbi:hypothetical protein G9A89_015144 [Geosiphon pyriformis]|nr:hypothetical protein G9A89_015144 [Geosiphon pyriformis]